MPVTVVVGGQFGSEGKGKVAYFLAKEMDATIAVRVGGSNSGHTVIGPDGKPWIFRHLPTAALLPDTTCVLPAGSYINVDVLMKEVFRVGLVNSRLIIDPNAIVITMEDIEEEEKSSLRQAIGSTVSGTGAGVVKRIRRDLTVVLAKHDERLRQFVRPAAIFMRENLYSGRRIIIEGTQGFGLSVLHSPYYPYATSRDTTAAAFVSETGLSPFDVDEVVLVLRSFPIRVTGNSGPLENEINWNTVSCESGASNPITEYTSVTKTLRRIGRFNVDLVREAILVNQPSKIVLNHLDYVDHKCRNEEALTPKAFNFIRCVESGIARKIDYIGTGPHSLKQLRTEKLSTVRGGQ
jgi:adenylosuccinate synthase